jgi:hypothetical protein
MVVTFGATMRSKGQVFQTKTVGERDHPVYVVKYYGTFCVDGDGKLCNSCSAFQSVHTRVNTFCLIVNFTYSDWEPQHITIGVFEASNTVGAILIIIVKRLLLDFHLTDKVILYVKNEGSNLTTLALALTLVVFCKPLALL